MDVFLCWLGFHKYSYKRFFTDDNKTEGHYPCCERCHKPKESRDE